MQSVHMDVMDRPARTWSYTDHCMCPHPRGTRREMHAQT